MFFSSSVLVKILDNQCQGETTAASGREEVSAIRSDQGTESDIAVRYFIIEWKC